MTKVLVVDDSALMRRHLRGILEDEGVFEVVTARNGIDALEQIQQVDPDVVTLDINMPEMDGLTCLSHIMDSSPRPVVMVSSLTASGALATFEALELGAVDYLAKPGGTVSHNMRDHADELVEKVRGAARARVRGRGGARTLGERLRRRRDEHGAALRRRPSRDDASTAAGTRAELVVIGASTGGPGILGDILAELPASFPLPIIIAQHIPASFSGPLAKRLDTECALTVEEVGASRPLAPGLVLVGRGDHDVVLTKRGGAMAARAVPNDPNLRWHPSVDRLVRSAMGYYDPRAVIAVQLTGMGDDGAQAMADLHAQGGRTIAESQDSAVVWGMPGELVQRGGATKVLPYGQVADQLLRWI